MYSILYSELSLSLVLNDNCYIVLFDSLVNPIIFFEVLLEYKEIIFNFLFSDSSSKKSYFYLFV